MADIARRDVPANREIPSFRHAVRVGIVVELADGSVYTVRCDDATDVTFTVNNHWPEEECLTFTGRGLPESRTFTVQFGTYNDWRWERRG